MLPNKSGGGSREKTGGSGFYFFGDAFSGSFVLPNFAEDVKYSDVSALARQQGENGTLTSGYVIRIAHTNLL
jgi:hypothetical protein